LEGFDDDWNYVGTQRNATYTNLNPGKYIFKVKASNNDGVWNEEGKELEIVVTPPFWKKVWFRVLVVVFMLGVVVLTFRIRLHNLRVKSRELQEKVNVKTKEIQEVNNILLKRNEEISVRNEEINTQNEKLYELNEEVIQQNEELVLHRERLEELVKERTAELEMAKKNAEKSEQLKSAFLKNISHEIRTPLNAVIGFANLALDRKFDKETRMLYKEIVNKNAEGLLRTIDDILNVSKIDSGNIELNISETSVNKLIHQMYNLYTNLDDEIGKKDVIFKVSELEKDCVLKTDLIRLNQVLINMLDNAFKFTKKGYVELGAIKHKEDRLELYVKDTGIGISDELKEVIFNRFMKIEDTQSDVYRGTGLGLYLSKRITEILGGDILFESELGVGSVFRITLKLF
jgi:signal transduction histidine kinase